MTTQNNKSNWTWGIAISYNFSPFPLFLQDKRKSSKGTQGILANLTLNGLEDRWKNKANRLRLKQKRVLVEQHEYMKFEDDFLVIGWSKRQRKRIKIAIDKGLFSWGLPINNEKTAIQPILREFTFVTFSSLLF